MIELLRIPDVTKTTTIPRSSLYKLIENGLFPRQVRIGMRFAGFIKHEVDAMLDAWVKGLSHDEIKALVKKLHADRLKTETAA